MKRFAFTRAAGANWTWVDAPDTWALIEARGPMEYLCTVCVAGTQRSTLVLGKLAEAKKQTRSELDTLLALYSH